MNTSLAFIIIFCFLCFASCKKEVEKVENIPMQKVNNWDIQWLTTSGRHIVDEQGQYIQLRGINQRVPFLFDVTFADGRYDNEYVPPFTKEDVQEIAKLGFNHLRLPINWSAFEPQKDVYMREEFFEKIHEVLDWCRAVGIYVLLDIHADAWSKEIGEDGMPGWTIYPENYKPMEGPLNFTSLALRRANPQVFKCYRDLVLNNHNIRDEYLYFWNSMIEEFKDNPAIIGFEPLNEPTAYFGGVTERQFLDFYKVCSQNMRNIDTRHILWLEPDAARNIVGTAPLLGAPFPDGNIIYCPHYYPNLTSNVSENTIDGWKSATNKAFDRILQEGRSWNAPIVINEWGINPSTYKGMTLVAAFMEQMELRNIHSTFWLWREPKPGTSGADGTWGFFTDLGDGRAWASRDDAKKNIAVPYALSLPAPYKTHYFDRATKVFTCTFDMTTQDTGSPILYIPEHWYPSGYRVIVNNEEVAVTTDNYQRVSFDWKPVAGENIIEIVAR